MSKRIVSLSATATELIGEIGLQGSIIGRSHECDVPDSVLNMPICTEPRKGRYGLRLGMEQDARSIVREALSIHKIIPEVLAQLKPDVIVTESLAKEYGVSDEVLQQAATAICGSKAEIINIQATNLQEIATAIQQLGDKLNASGKGRELANRFQKVMTDAQSHLEKHTTKPKVLCLQWLHPLVAAGNWMPALVEMAGGENLISKAGEASKMTTWDQIIALDPEKIILMPAGEDMEKVGDELQWLNKTNEFRTLTAFKSKQVFTVDANHYFNRPTPKLADSLSALAELIHLPKPSKRKFFGTIWSEFF